MRIASLAPKLLIRESTQVAAKGAATRGAKRAATRRPSSAIGEAVLKALDPKNRRTVPHSLVASEGAIRDVWLKGHSEATNEIIDKVLEELVHTKNEIRIQTFVVDFTAPSFKRLMAALADKQRVNPKFKVMMVYGGEFRFHLNPKIAGESLPKAWNSTDMKQALREHGVNAQVASFIRTPDLAVLHTKSYVFDGKTAVIGSANLTDTQSKEVMLKVEGPIVRSFLHDFADAWRQAKSHFEVRNGRVLKSGPRSLWPAPAHPRGPAAADAVPLTFLSKPAGKAFSGSYLKDDATRGLMAAMGAARREIKLFSPNFNNPDVWANLVEAADRGVKVNIMLPKDFNNLRAAVDGGNNYQFLTRDLAQLPERLRKRFEVRWYSADGVSTGPATDHIKYMSIDDQWTYLGSQNFDNQAWKKSREGGLGIDDATQTKLLARVLFDEDWARALPVEVPKAARNLVRRWLQRWLGI